MERKTKDGKGKSPSKARRVILIVLADTLLLALCIGVFAYFHFLKPETNLPDPVVIEKPTETPAVENTPETAPEVTAEPTEALPLTWKEKFADKFSDGEVIQTENSFISENTNITVTRVEKTLERVYQGAMTSYPLVYYVADIYITDVEQLQATFAKGEYLPKSSASPLKQVSANNGIVGINGDNYGSRTVGLVVRNGVLYRQDLYEGDVLALYYDGTMEAFYYNEVNIDEIVAKGPYQAWSFGPVLVMNGQAVVSPQSSNYINGDNPRTAIGYYEPGHYCMVVIEGRSDDSIGADVNYLSQIFVDLGCDIAYNLDGGRTSAMVFGDEYVNVRASGGRNSNDTIIITDPEYTTEEEQ